MQKNKELLDLNNELKRLYTQWLEVQPLGKEYAQRLWQRLRIEWNYNSNHIEGNTLTYGETLLLLIHGRTRGEHLLREYEEMRGHDVAIEHVRSLAEDTGPITENDIRDLNRILLKEGFWRVAQTIDGEPTRKWIEPGRYKTQPNHVITAAGELFQFTSPGETPAQMSDFVLWLRNEIKNPSIGLMKFLTLMHQRFIRIHPFDDGNGRVVRLLVNYVLLKTGLPPLVVKTKKRKQYLSSIASADTGDFKPLQKFFEETLEWSLRLGITAATTMITLEDDLGIEDENDLSENMRRRL